MAHALASMGWGGGGGGAPAGGAVWRGWLRPAGWLDPPASTSASLPPACRSNRPQVLRAVLLDWRDRCSERQRRQLQAHRALRGGAAVRQAQQEGQRQRQLQPGGWP